MSFLNAIKRSFGFGKDVDDGLLDDSADRPVDSMTLSDSPQTDQTEDTSDSITVDKAEIDMIFDHVVNIFNDALPEFLKQAVDPEIQRKKIYDSLDNSIKTYLASISDQTRRQCEARWCAEQTEMRGEMEHLKAKAKEIEQQRFDIKQQQLSADRQRRALTNKVQALENQVASFEAEREQFDLENKSLVNKLKVAAVHESEAQALRDELIDARAEIVALRNASATGEEPEPNTDNNGVIARLEDEISKLNTQLEQAAEKDRIATEMFNGLQSKASAARSELSARNAEIESLKQKLAEAENVRSDIDQLNKQMALVEAAIDKRDRKIAKLKEKCDKLQNENESLRNTISDNLKTYASTEDTLKRRIAELEADPTTPIAESDLFSGQAVETEPEPTIIATPRISDSDLNAIDDNFDNSDWLSSEPTVTPSMRANVNEADFGYQPPTRKNNRHDNEAQLSLF
ncbi:MAG: hypothetical protein K2M77_01040 [Muribaculaceae bacterium]|nr:hypothetical protein [Muribaculaceae bacterium]